MNWQIKEMLIQTLRNHLTDMKATLPLIGEEALRKEYELRVGQTESLLVSVDPPHPYL